LDQNQIITVYKTAKILQYIKSDIKSHIYHHISYLK